MGHKWPLGRKFQTPALYSASVFLTYFRASKLEVAFTCRHKCMFCFVLFFHIIFTAKETKFYYDFPQNVRTVCWLKWDKLGVYLSILCLNPNFQLASHWQGQPNGPGGARGHTILWADLEVWKSAF